MIASRATKPAYQTFSEADIKSDGLQFVLTVSRYYTDSKTGHLLSQPLDSSTLVLHYNKGAFKKVDSDPEQPPKIRQNLTVYATKLKVTGMRRDYIGGWQGWIQIENFSTWHDLPVATRDSGFGGTGAALESSKLEQVRYIALLEEIDKKGDFDHFGRKDESTKKFHNGDCVTTTVSSGSLADIRQYAKLNYGVDMVPYDADVKDTSQDAIIGGASP